MKTYKELKEERSLLVEKANASADEEVRASISAQIVELDGHVDALVERAESELRAAESFGRLQELTASSKGEDFEELELRDLVYSAAGSSESRASVTVPTFLESNDFYTSNPLADREVIDFVNRFDIARAPYKEYTERLHALGGLDFVAASEASAITRTDTAIAQFSTVSTSKIAALTSLSAEALAEVSGLEADLLRKINHAYSLAVRDAIVTSVQAATTTVNAAAAAVSVSDVIDLLWDTFTADDRAGSVLLASPSAMSDLAKDAGDDDFYFDPTITSKVIQGVPVILTPTLGGTDTGDVAVAAVNPSAVSVRASGLRVSRDESFYFNNDEVAFRGTAYLGAAINNQDYIANLVRL